MELLVVIGIIAILIAILLPGLQKAMAQARTIQCQSNLRQIAMWGLIYAQDWKGVLPANGGPLPDTYGGNRRYYGAELGETLWFDRGFRKTDWRNLQCPEAQLQLQPRPTSGYGHRRLLEYSLNMNLGGRQRNAIASSPNPIAKTIRLKSSAIWFGDAGIYMGGSEFNIEAEIGIGAGAQRSPWPWACDPSFGGGYPLREGHPGRRANFVFGDGHTESLSYSDFLAMGTEERRKLSAAR